MNRKRSKAVAFVLAVLMLVLSLTACADKAQKGGEKGQTETQQDNTDNAAQAMGRYVEETIDGPQAGYMLTMRKLSDGRLRAVMESDFGRTVWDSKDEGGTWEKAGDFPEAAASVQTSTLTETVISPNGEILISFYEYGGDEQQEPESDVSAEAPLDTELEEQVLLFTPGGESHAISISLPAAGGEPDYIQSYYFMQDNTLLVCTVDGSIYRINRDTGAIELTYETTGAYIRACTDIEGRLLVVTDREAAYFDTETGKLQTKDETLTKQLALGDASDTDAVHISLEASLLMIADDTNKAVFYCTQDGLFRHVADGSLSEQVINGALNSLGNPGLYMLALAQLSGDRFLVAASDDTGSTLLRYTYDPNISAVPEREVRLYSLTDNSLIRQAIANFQKAHTDIYINYQVGMSGEDGVIVSDAVKNLNTDILAEKGPDMIILDEMPVDSYIEKGMLADLSDVCRTLLDGDGAFKNVVETYRQDEKLYAIPCSFAIPAVQGERTAVESINGLETLVQAAKTLREQNPDRAYILNFDSAQTLLRRLFTAFAPEWQEDGVFVEERLKEALSQAKELYVQNQDSDVPQSSLFFEESGNGGYTMTTNDSLEAASVDLLLQGCMLNFGYLDSIRGMGTVEAVSNGLTDGTWKLFSEEKNVYIPELVAGISTKGANQEDAALFLSYLLSGEVQRTMLYDGFPVNLTAFNEAAKKQAEDVEDASMAISTADGSFVDFNLEPLTDEQLTKLKSRLETACIPAVTDRTMETVFVEQGKKVLEGTLDPEVAAQEIVQKCNLYLSE